MRFVPSGDTALLVEWREEISVEINTQVRALEYLIGQKDVPGVIETVPAFRSLLVYYDPRVVGGDELRATLETLAEQARTTELPPARCVELPCCYDPELGPDLVAAAQRLELAVDELVRVHAGAAYLVYFIGFTPGLPYMSLPPRNALPRRETPRLRVPAGSVGIGGAQSCIYSVDSPGGFWLLGRTPLRLYDPGASDPVLLRAGDRVRLRPIDRAEFDDIARRVAARAYAPVIA